jgi:KaiC/GvpD/RAD55 family RecA-like ATPase
MGFLGKLKSEDSQNLKNEQIDIDKLANAVAEKIKKRTPKEHKIISKEIQKQRESVQKKVQTIKKNQGLKSDEWIKTGIPGLDKLFEKGIPRGTSVLIAGGAGSGKTIMCLQILNNAAKNNEKVLYISLEETEFRLKKHMHDFGWNPEELEKKGLLKIVKIQPFTIARQVEALLIKEKGELNINIEELGELIPKNFKPQWIVVDSLTALASAFNDVENSYRIYIEQLFEYLSKLGATSFLISETEQIPTRFSKTGVEEFLADGVIVLYNIKHGNLKENAIEVLKLRGAKHEKKIVAMQILPEGIVVYPEQEIFSNF